MCKKEGNREETEDSYKRHGVWTEERKLDYNKRLRGLRTTRVSAKGKVTKHQL